MVHFYATSIGEALDLAEAYSKSGYRNQEETDDHCQIYDDRIRKKWIGTIIYQINELKKQREQE